MMLHEPDAKAQEDRSALPKPSLSRTITPGYMAAVMSSPDVLCNLCQQYFRQYDKNKNGFLDCHEAVEIAKDLGSTLAVPLGSTEEVLRPSLKRFSEEGRDALTLEEFSRWFPSVLGLEPLSPQHIQEMTSSAKEKWDPMASEQQLARQSLTPGYIAALASSPQTVRTLCKQFFKQYDANANGVLEFTEVRKLASDLSITLGISIDESRLKERLDTANSSGDAALSLDALCSWLPQLVENQTPPAQRILPAEQAPAVPKGHVEALRRSPRILVQLCRQYFRMYDRNQNSVLDDAELIVLAKDLGQCLGVTLGSQKELQDSIVRFSDGSDCLTFGEFVCWFATMMGVESAAMKEINALASPTA